MFPSKVFDFLLSGALFLMILAISFRAFSKLSFAVFVGSLPDITSAAIFFKASPPCLDNSLTACFVISLEAIFLTVSFAKGTTRLTILAKILAKPCPF